jgi:hypothetical protein
MDTLYDTLIIKRSEWHEIYVIRQNTHQDSFSMFDGQVLVLECQDRATSCIEVCDMITSRIRNGSEWSSELDIASVSRLDYKEAVS